MTMRSNCLKVKEAIKLLDAYWDGQIAGTEKWDTNEYPLYSDLKPEIKLLVDKIKSRAKVNFGWLYLCKEDGASDG